MAEYTAPVFIPTRTTAAAKHGRAPQKRGAKRTVPDSVVAAIRCDYEYGLMFVRALQAKYANVVGITTVARISRGEMRPEVKAAQCAHTT
jgi:hypothetical protein